MTGRSATMVYRAAERFAAELTRLAAAYPASQHSLESPARLPLHVDLRHALNVAACDSSALVVFVESKGNDLTGALAKASWSDAFIGSFEWVQVNALNDETLALLQGGKSDANLLVIEPEPYGRSGRVLVQASVESKETEIATVLSKGLKLHDPAPKDPRRHIGLGEKQGVNWEPVIPVTDPGPDKARRRR